MNRDYLNWINDRYDEIQSGKMNKAEGNFYQFKVTIYRCGLIIRIDIKEESHSRTPTYTTAYPTDKPKPRPDATKAD